MGLHYFVLCLHYDYHHHGVTLTELQVERHTNISTLCGVCCRLYKDQQLKKTSAFSSAAEPKPGLWMRQGDDGNFQAHGGFFGLKNPKLQGVGNMMTRKRK